MIFNYFLPDVFKYLESDEQRQLRLVSREWNVFLLPFVFSRLSTDMYEGFEELLPKYSDLVRELHVTSLDGNMADLLSGCKKTTRLMIDFDSISPEEALILGENFPRLSYLELYHVLLADIRYLGPLTKKSPNSPLFY
ncbi:hypothetical protein DSO57_1032833 [Entomophthora muscae]|uniref:Uncharacterized protein n=1 Tax=Entomophthora muscae TaxID=34485 RepID=A0ACC2UL19_9FUNG|nr:hypothetical protein DSO57_1032833 [Entomophthora muscae]